MIIADTSGLLASFNDREPQHERVRRCLDKTTETLRLAVSPLLAPLIESVGTAGYRYTCSDLPKGESADSPRC